MANTLDDCDLHIFHQDAWHDDAYICGNPNALRRLGEALIAAAESGKASAFSAFATDGEGYSVVCIPFNEEQMEELRLPYTYEYARCDRGKWPIEMIQKSDYEAAIVASRQPNPEPTP